MSAVHATAARRERQGARALGTARVLRARGESAPDVLPVRTLAGIELQAEVKSRSRLPYLVTAALKQAEGYAARGAKGARPVAIVFQKGTAGGIACVRLADFAALVGLDVAQLPKATPMRRAPRASGASQMSLFEKDGTP